MNSFINRLKAYVENNPPNFGNGESVLTLLYEVHNELNTMDNDQIKMDFNELYRAMNGMSLKEIDQIIYPVCILCRDHEKAGFLEGVKIGIRLRKELFE